MRTTLMRRLRALEARRPTVEDEDQRGSDAAWQAILAHPDAADLLRIMDRVAVLVEQGYPEDGPEVHELVAELAMKLDAQEG